MELTSHAGGAAALLEAGLEDNAVGLAWLGQAGFVVRHAGCRVLIDPYLPDHLARKYAGTEFPHARMMPAPLEADNVRDLDWVLCSHRHGDHMDSGSLAANNPRCRFYIANGSRSVRSCLENALNSKAQASCDRGNRFASARDKTRF